MAFAPWHVQFSRSWRRVSDLMNSDEKSNDGPPLLVLNELNLGDGRGDGAGDAKGDPRGDGVGDPGLLQLQLQFLEVCIDTSEVKPSSG